MNKVENNNMKSEEGKLALELEIENIDTKIEKHNIELNKLNKKIQISEDKLSNWLKVRNAYNKTILNNTLTQALVFFLETAASLYFREAQATINWVIFGSIYFPIAIIVVTFDETKEYKEDLKSYSREDFDEENRINNDKLNEIKKSLELNSKKRSDLIEILNKEYINVADFEESLGSAIEIVKEINDVMQNEEFCEHTFINSNTSEKPKTMQHRKR